MAARCASSISSAIATEAEAVIARSTAIIVRILFSFFVFFSSLVFSRRL